MPPQRCAISFSTYLAAVLSALHVAAGTLAALMSIPVWAKAISIVAVLWSLKHCLGEVALLRTPGAIVVVDVTREGRVFCRTRRGEWLDCELLPSSFVSHRLTILNLRVRGTQRTRYVMLCGDNVDPADFRRLRAWLRWAASRAVGRTQATASKRPS
ncbi:MAG: hypothetical protein OEP48_05150 [Betaproteobacteria bacterium]|nr:hypothetical protein [Betaproteobacteria bacterium]MDH3437274.1 hypothetical protein [Betaproteobacteria bacterium]